MLYLNAAYLPTYDFVMFEPNSKKIFRKHSIEHIINIIKSCSGLFVG